MAEDGNVPERGGYDYEFTSRVPEDLECLVCHLTMKDPVQIVGCGHRLCNICMESLLRHPSPTCPADQQLLLHDKIFPDTACHRKIMYLAVKCSYSGCSWTGELQAVEEHQSECPFKVVQCPNSGCTEKFKEQDLHGHMTLECSWRKINCGYCEELYIKNQKQKHLDVCQKFPVECTNKCGVTDILREKLDVHIREDCPATEVQCEYKNLGCEALFPRSNTKSHSETQVERHLILALRGFEATQLQVNELVSLVKDQSQQIEKLNYSPFIWRIPNFETIRERAAKGKQEVIFSEPFYLFRGGYRLKIKMRPNGGASNPILNKKLKGKFLSLCIIVIPGDYDWMLPWPFTEKVRVTLIDQEPLQDLREDISKVIDFKTVQFPRPVKESDLGLGIGSFVEQNVLQTRSYLSNNTMFIMVSKNNAEL